MDGPVQVSRRRRHRLLPHHTVQPAHAHAGTSLISSTTSADGCRARAASTAGLSPVPPTEILAFDAHHDHPHRRLVEGLGQAQHAGQADPVGTGQAPRRPSASGSRRARTWTVPGGAPTARRRPRWPGRLRPRSQQIEWVDDGPDVGRRRGLSDGTRRDRGTGAIVAAVLAPHAGHHDPQGADPGPDGSCTGPRPPSRRGSGRRTRCRGHGCVPTVRNATAARRHRGRGRPGPHGAGRPRW